MRFALLCLSLTALLATQPCRAADFAGDAKAWSDEHADLFENAAKLGAEGYPAAGNQILLALADEDTSPLAAYVIGNTLYNFDPVASYRLHAHALEGFPQERAVALQVALEEHRRGEYAGAIINYRFVLRTGNSPQFSALLADCLLHTGDLKGAVEAWKQADHARRHAEIDAAICTVYGPLSPVQRRGDLIAQIEAKDLAKLTDLILLDLSFDSDWWNAKVYADGLDADLKRASLLQGHRDGRYRALAVYAKLARAPERKRSEIERELKQLSLVIGSGATLPDDSRIARALCELAVTAQLVSTADLWTAYEATLRSRLEKQDRDALHLLCWLAAANRNRVLTEFNQLGWEEWNDPTFASSFMVDLYREKKLTSPNDSQLMAALAVSPNNITLHKLRISLAGDNVPNDMIAAALKAEYHKLSVGETVPDSTMLDGLFDALGKQLPATP